MDLYNYSQQLNMCEHFTEPSQPKLSGIHVFPGVYVFCQERRDHFQHFATATLDSFPAISVDETQRLK